MSKHNDEMPTYKRLAVQGVENVTDLVVAARDLVEPVSLSYDYVEPLVRKVDADGERFKQAALDQYGIDVVRGGLTEEGNDRVLARMNTRYGSRLTRLGFEVESVEGNLDLDPEVRKSLTGILVGHTIYEETKAMERRMF